MRGYIRAPLHLSIFNFLGLWFFVGVVVLDDLPDLNESEAELVRLHPMPVGQPDALLNKKLLAVALGVSITTIDSWCLSGMPAIKSGTNGAAYQFRLSICYAWRCARQAAEQAETVAANAAAAQMRLNLIGGEPGDIKRAALTPKEQREVLALEREWILTASARREFIRTSDVVSGLEACFNQIRDALDATPDLISRECNLPTEATERIQEILDAVLKEAHAHVTKNFNM